MSTITYHSTHELSEIITSFEEKGLGVSSILTRHFRLCAQVVIQRKPKSMLQNFGNELSVTINMLYGLT
jgi:hypothetical protein